MYLCVWVCVAICLSFCLSSIKTQQCALHLQTRDALGKFVKKAIVHYRDDLDLQNLMDYIQKEVTYMGNQLRHNSVTIMSPQTS